MNLAAGSPSALVVIKSVFFRNLTFGSRPNDGCPTWLPPDCRHWSKSRVRRIEKMNPFSLPSGPVCHYPGTKGGQSLV
ncbi:hypothetical protein GCM10022281_18730 [Sphingomonas rosea]|uniref:Uncharacterized protein n=1 Tax=Sphingomonas rosea TaxID=335605 RepID=A0ABP7U949_9SPHN